MPRGFPIGKTVHNNSTLTPLAADAEYKGEWVKVEDYPSVVCVAKSDVAGTLYMEFIHKPDGELPSEEETADSSLGYNIRAGVAEPPHKLTCARPWFRARYVNGEDAQTSFELITTIGDHGLIVAPANLSLAQNTDSIPVRTIEQELDIAEGKRAGWAKVNKLGKNSDVDTGTVPEFIIESGGIYAGFPLTGAETIDVFSSSANDTAAGSGARSVTMFGLDENWEVQSETITLNGTTAVTTTGQWQRLHSAFVKSSGSSNQAFNDGTLTFRHTTTTANVFLSIIPGSNQSNYAVYTIPAGKVGIIKRYCSSIRRGTATSVDGAFWIRTDGDSPRYRRPFTLSQTSPLKQEPFGGNRFAAKTDIAPVVTASTANNVSVVFAFDIILIDV